METYSSGALWNNPPVGLNRLETEDSETSKAVFHFLAATWQDYPAKSFFPGQILVPKSFTAAAVAKVPQLTQPLLPQIPTAVCFHRGGILTQNSLPEAVLKGSAENKKSTLHLGTAESFGLEKNLKFIYFQPPTMDNFHYPRLLRSPSSLTLKRHSQSGNWEVLLFNFI